MALPTLVKTYQFDVNKVAGTGAGVLADNQGAMFAIKDALVSFATKPWTVSRSSDGVTADASDNWVDAADLVWSLGAHSWIVLKAPGDVGYEILIDLDTPVSYQTSKIAVSPGGLYTGGDASNAPTATDEIILEGSSNRWFTTSTTAHASKVHVIHSDDGNVTTVLGFYNNSCTCFWRFEVLADAMPDWTDKVIVRISGSLMDCCSFTNLTSTSATYTQSVSWEGATSWWPQFSYEAIANTEKFVGLSPATENELDGNNNPIGGMGLWSLQSPYRGKMGNMTDMWWGRNGLAAPVAHFPDTPTLYQFVQINNLVLPWDSANQIQTS